MRIGITPSTCFSSLGKATQPTFSATNYLHKFISRSPQNKEDTLEVIKDMTKGYVDDGNAASKAGDTGLLMHFALQVVDLALLNNIVENTKPDPKHPAPTP